MTAATLPPIEGKTTVNVPLEQAFQVFTASFGSWWPHAYHIGQAEVADVILEPPHALGRRPWHIRSRAKGDGVRPGRCARPPWWRASPRSALGAAAAV